MALEFDTVEKMQKNFLFVLPRKEPWINGVFIKLRGKIPLEPGYSPTNPSLDNRAHYSYANIVKSGWRGSWGIIGTTSKDYELLRVDVDGYRLHEKTWKEVKSADFPPTTTVKRGEMSFHLYYYVRKEVKIPGFIKHIENKTHGVTVIPGTRHKSGDIYRLVNDLEPYVLSDISELPGVIFKEPKKKEETESKPVAVDLKGDRPCIKKAIQLTKKDNEQHVDNILLRDYFKSRGISDIELVEAFRKWKGDKFNREKTEYQVRHWKTKKYMPESCQKMQDRGLCVRKCGRTYVLQELKRTEGKKKRTGRFFTEAGGIDYEELIADIRAEYVFKTFRDSEEIFWFDQGLYRPDGDGIIREGVEKRLGVYGKIHVKSETIGHIRDRTRVDRGEFNKDKNLLPVKNGLLDMTTLELKPFDPEIMFTYQIPVEFRPKAKCPKIMKFLSEVLRKADILLIQETSGYCFYPGYPAHRSFWCFGEGGNGKGTLFNLLRKLLGTENLEAIKLGDLEYSKFARASLYGKMVNLISEPNPRRMEKSTVLKQMTGGDLVSGEIKGIQKRIHFINQAKMLVAVNQIPEIVDISYAYWRRIVAVEFPNRFEGDNEDKELLGKLTTEEELSGFLNWALEGLKRLRENRWNFSVSKTSEETKEVMKLFANPVYAFLRGSCAEDIGAWIPKNELYEAYKEYCGEKGLIVKSNNVFAIEIRKYMRVETARLRVGEERINVWKGIGFLSGSGQGGQGGQGIITLGGLTKKNSKNKNKKRKKEIRSYKDISALTTLTALTTKEDSEIHETKPQRDRIILLRNIIL